MTASIIARRISEIKGLGSALAGAPARAKSRIPKPSNNPPLFLVMISKNTHQVLVSHAGGKPDYNHRGSGELPKWSHTSREIIALLSNQPLHNKLSQHFLWTKTSSQWKLMNKKTKAHNYFPFFYNAVFTKAIFKNALFIFCFQNLFIFPCQKKFTKININANEIKQSTTINTMWFLISFF